MLFSVGCLFVGCCVLNLGCCDFVTFLYLFAIRVVNVGQFDLFLLLGSIRRCFV